MTEEKPKLSKADEVFVSEYLLCFNATAAYKKAHPSAKNNTAATNGWKLLRKTEIKEAITARLDEVHMGADEALKLTADIARGDITDFITPFGNVDVDLLKQSGKGRLVKKIKQKTVTKIGKKDDDEDTEVLETELELYDAQSALRDILKIHDKIKDPTAKFELVIKYEDANNKPTPPTPKAE